MKIFRTKSNFANFWLDVVLITAVFACLAYIFFWPVRVTGNSMSPTVNMGDHLIVSRFLGVFGSFSSGDLVVAAVETDGTTEIIIKRIVATPNDHLVISANALFLNGERRDELFYPISSIAMNVDIVLGDNEYFILGDNIAVSNDSRHFGPITNRQIVAKILIKYFPLSVIEIF